MKLLLLLLLLPATIYAQSRPISGRQMGGTTVPIISCNVTTTSADTYVRTTTGVFYVCTAPNVWTPLAGGGGGITNAAPLDNIPKSDGTDLVPSLLSESAGTLTTSANDFIFSAGAALTFGGNKFQYQDTVGPTFFDDSTNRFLFFNVQSLSANRTISFPNSTGTLPLVNFAQSWTANQTFGSGILRSTRPQFTTSIDDSAGNELFGVTATASAVNEFTIANAAAGSGPTASATGSDTDIDINLTPKGTGSVRVNGTGTSALGIGDSDNSHFLNLIAGSNLTADRNLTILTGDAARTLTLSGDATIPAGTVSATIASGTSALGTSAISSGTCATAVTTAATGTATTDVVSWGFNTDVTGITGYAPVTTGALTIFANPITNSVVFRVCNMTSASITPGAVTLNWRIVR